MSISLENLHLLPREHLEVSSLLRVSLWASFYDRESERLGDWRNVSDVRSIAVGEGVECGWGFSGSSFLIPVLDLNFCILFRKD